MFYNTPELQKQAVQSLELYAHVFNHLVTSYARAIQSNQDVLCSDFPIDYAISAFATMLKITDTNFSTALATEVRTLVHNKLIAAGYAKIDLLTQDEANEPVATEVPDAFRSAFND